MTLPPDCLSRGEAFPVGGEALDALPRMKLVLFRSGYGASLATVPQELRREADLAYAEGKRLAAPRALVLCRAPADMPPRAAPPEFYASRLACAFVSSLGPAIDAEVDALFARGAPLKGALLDAWSSESLEAFNESLHRALSAAASGSGLRPVKMNGVERYSPGYGAVPALANADWVSAFPAGLVDASGKTGILTPRKSTVCLLAWDGAPG